MTNLKDLFPELEQETPSDYIAPPVRTHHEIKRMKEDAESLRSFKAHIHLTVIRLGGYHSD